MELEGCWHGQRSAHPAKAIRLPPSDRNRNQQPKNKQGITIRVGTDLHLICMTQQRVLEYVNPLFVFVLLNKILDV